MDAVRVRAKRNVCVREVYLLKTVTSLHEMSKVARSIKTEKNWVNCTKTGELWIKIGVKQLNE